MIKKCKLCEIDFVDNTKNHNKLFCCVKHANKYWYDNSFIKASKKWKKASKKCLRCNTVFTPTGKNQKYCSKTCCYNITHKHKRYNDINFKLRHNLRSRLRKNINSNKHNKKTIKLLGCSIEELKIYLESKFQPGMTWDNYGLRGWHIDHIIPLCHFNLFNPEQLKKACHYSNLQPLWAEENLKKNSKQITKGK